MRKATAKRPRALKTTGILALFLLLALTTLHFANRQHIKGDIIRLQRALNASFQYEMDEEAQKLYSIAGLLAQDPELQQAMKAGDYTLLDTLALPSFTESKKIAGITRLAFLSPEGDYLLRTHNPWETGGRLERHSLTEAQTTGEPSYGIELEESGNFLLRTLTPWKQDDTLLGYIEVGSGIQGALKDIKRSLELRIYLVVDQDYLHKDRQEGAVIIDQSLNQVPHPLLSAIQIHKTRDAAPFVFFKEGDAAYAGSFIPLKDGSGTRVGNVWFATNITHDANTLKNQKVILVGAFLFLTILFFLFKRPQDLT